MARKRKSFEDLVEEALENAQKDRSLAGEAFEKMKRIFAVVDVEDPNTLQSVMLTGQQAVKLLESMSRSNDQILKAATLMQKDEKSAKSDEDDGPFDLEKLKKNNLQS